MINPYKGQKIVFFDGVCILCNRSVDFLLKKDYKKRLKFASLQSESATNFLQQDQYHPFNEDTIIFYDEGRFFTKSTAVLKIAGNLGFPYYAVVILFIIPRPLRDWVYDYIARNRIRWFGQRETCRVPDPGTAGRILL
jgi:predicted DCC family thiol-disulfide oxidoreductase YuxK